MGFCAEVLINSHIFVSLKRKVYFCKGNMVIQRIPYIDSIKTICIFLMVVGHWTSNEVVLTYIYSFHMPALFVVSGFLYKPRPWIKTILSFGIPVAFYSLLNLLYLLVISEISIYDIFTREIFFRFFHYRYGLGTGLFMGDWFIWALLALRLFCGDISLLKGLRRYYIYIALFAIIYMSFEGYFIRIDSLFRGWFVGRAFPSIPFFFLGIYLKEKGWNPNVMSQKVCVTFFIIAVLVPLLNGYCSINENIYGKAYGVFLLNAIVSTLFLFSLLSHFKATKYVTIFSKGTLLILGLHIPILKTLEMILPMWTRDILPLLVLPLCFYPILWIDKWCPELLGKVR